MTERKLKRWLSKTKVTPPRRRVQMIARPALIECLDEAPKGGVITVLAPAGYGKSSLLAEWRQLLLERGEKCAWVCLDEGDDAEIVLAHIAYAFHLMGVDFDKTGVLEPGDMNDANLARELRTILGVLEREECPLYLVFDDCERCEDEIARDVLAPMLRWAPDNLILVFCGRTELPLDFSGALLRGMLVSLAVEDLKFDDAEIHQIYGEEASSSEIETIAAASEGWPALIQLARSGNISITATASVYNIGSGFELFADYLNKAVLAPLPGETLDFLISASAFSEIPVEFFKDRFPSGTIQRFIDGDHSLGEFLAPLDDDPLVLRMHPLVRECLRERLYKERGEEAAALHAEAAVWLAEAGREISAMRHASQIDNLSLVEEILFRVGGPTWLAFQGLRHLSRINALISDGKSRERRKSDDAYFPLVQLTKIIHKTKSGQTRDAQVELAELEAHCSKKQWADEARREIVEFSGAFARASLECYSHIPFSASNVRTLSRYRRSEIADTPYLQGSILNAEVVRCIEQCNFVQAIDSAKKTIQEFRAAPSTFGEAHVSLLLSAAYLSVGDAEKARGRVLDAEAIIANSLNGDKEFDFVLNTMQSVLRFETSLGGIAKIKDLAAQIIENLEKVDIWYDFIAIACLHVVDGYVIQNKVQRAFEFLSDARAVAERRDQTRLCVYLDYTALLTGLRDGADLRTQPSLETQHTWRDTEVVAESVFLHGRAIGQYDVGFADQALRRAAESGNRRSEIRLRFAKAQFLWTRGKHDDAIAEASTACDVVARTGFLSAAALSSGILKTLLEVGDVPGRQGDKEERCSSTLLATYERVMQSSIDPVSDSRLTHMERRVAKELVHGGADKEIARTLDISHNTVRFHLKNIYRKLGVANRTQAVQKLN